VADRGRQNRIPEMEQDEWYKRLFDFAPNLFMVLDYEGVIIDCNLSFVKAAGFSSRTDVIGRPIYDFADKGSKDAIAGSLEVWRKTGTVHNHEFKMKRADSSIFPALLNATSIHDEFGRTIACNADVINITELANARKKADTAVSELRQREGQLNEINVELKKTEKAKEEFISMISHELKNPLTPIICFSEMLVSSAGTRLSEKETGLVLKILGNAKELKRLIEDMHTVYKLDMRLQHSFSETRIVEVVDDVLQETSSVMAEKGISVEKKISLRDGTSTSIKCDPMRIKQVLVNLLKNSADFVPSSGGKISLELEDTNENENQNRHDVTSPQSIGPFVMFSLKDNGPGVPSDKVSGLFMKFYQVDLKAIRRHGGTGLGLAICKEIVEMHGGSIWYDSAYKGGACFRFLLPALPGSRMSISDNS